MQQFNPQQPLDPKALAVTPYPTVASAANPPYPGARYGSEWNDESQSEVSVLQYWRILCRQRKTILVAAIAGLILGFLAGVPMKPVYRARTSLEVLSFNDDFMNVKETNPVSNGNSADTSAEENQSKLLQSDALRERVSRTFGFRKGAADAEADVAPTGWRHWLHLPAPTTLTGREWLINGVAESLKVQVTAHTHILEASVESSDRHLAADYANALAQAFIQQSMEARWSSTERTGQWLRREIEGARDRLRAAEDALQAYARESGLIFSDDNSNVATEKLQNMQQVLLAATAERIAKQSRFELLKGSPPEALPDLLTDDPSLREIRSKMNDLRRQIAVLTAAVYTSSYSKVKEAQAELAVLETAFEHSRADTLKQIESNYEEALRKENLLADAYATQVREVAGQSEKAIQYNILKRDVESNRQLYDNMLQQMKQATIAAAVHVSNVRVVDKATVPNRPVSPDFRINSVLGCLAGLFVSMFTVILRDQTDRSFRQPEDIKAWTDLPVLGTIPSAAIILKLTSRFMAILAYSSAPIALQRKSSVTADAFRSTLASILFLGKSSDVKVIVFTSTAMADGKTTSTTNLAIAAAEIGKRVLVVDADMRRPRVHEVFNLPNERGLSNLLVEALSEDHMAGCIQETAIPGLDVLTSGSVSKSASHLLYSQSLSLLLQNAEKRYDLVLIDTPPMLQMADARLVGALADAVVLVVRASQTDRGMLIAAQQRFHEDRTLVLGTILNGWDPTRDLGNYYREYQRYRTAVGGR
jgi:capsular exopolysaccharide synthesis family protein